MQIKVDLDDGFLPRIYTSNANVKHSGQPILSFPIEIKSIPAITTAFAISLIDYDAVPADFSRNFEGPQGQNSWMSRFYQLNDSYFADHYAGPNPPDQPHRYTLSVFALKHNLPLNNRFYYNDFREQLVGNVLTKAELQILAHN